MSTRVQISSTSVLDTVLPTITPVKLYNTFQSITGYSSSFQIDSTGRITYIGPNQGTLFFSVNAGLSLINGNFAQINLILNQNGNANMNQMCTQSLSSTNNTISIFTLSTILQVKQGDYFEIFIQNLTGSGNIKSQNVQICAHGI